MHVRPWLLLLLLPQCMSVSPHHFRQASESMQTNETDATRYSRLSHNHTHHHHRSSNLPLTPTVLICLSGHPPRINTSRTSTSPASLVTMQRHR